MVALLVLAGLGFAGLSGLIVYRPRQPPEDTAFAVVIIGFAVLMCGLAAGAVIGYVWHDRLKGEGERRVNQ